MERGLFWLPLLALFIWLAWAGWNEYQKLEAYRIWAQKFDRAKYDIYAVLGQKGSDLTWGKPTRKAPINLQTFSLKDVESIRVIVDDRAYNLAQPPEKGGTISLEFLFSNSSNSVRIPFTQLALAVQWGNALQQDLSG
ncbi:hypothetical protein ACE1CI_23830 [Aerosakkonemataceae cyanobacterium BLCC-F50]|uniref:Uncharacterized protein n=1 Tax=Floridaenema flaviceps BLCC-F50 TaxID=3153642 RepID=A0ABV4XY07_9CYAN